MLINCPECEKLISDKAKICVHCAYPFELDYHNRVLLTIEEACNYYKIGENKLRIMIKHPYCNFAVWNGKKCLIYREEFNKYLQNCALAGDELFSEFQPKRKRK